MGSGELVESRSRSTSFVVKIVNQEYAQPKRSETKIFLAFFDVSSATPRVSKPLNESGSFAFVRSAPPRKSPATVVGFFSVLVKGYCFGNYQFMLT